MADDDDGTTATATTTTTTVLAAFQFNAFVLNPGCWDLLNPGCCDLKKHSSNIVPISQPNYTFLRLHDNLITADLLGHAGLHCVSPASLNQRLTDFGSWETCDNRIGVYV